MRTVLTDSGLPIGHELLWYRVTGVLGRGGFGITYAALDTNLDQAVAIKEYFPRDSCERDTLLSVRPRSPAGHEVYDWGLRRFVDEARTVACLRHPNIVQVRTAFEHHGTAYMVMDLERGSTLREHWQASHCQEEDQVLHLAHALLGGLEGVHAAGFLHRDIKLDNIIVRADGSPVLVDFGSARAAADAASGNVTALVSRGFAPYEQYATGPADRREGPWSDIYSFAAVLYVLVTGCTPLDALKRGAALLAGVDDPLLPARQLAAGRYSEALLTAIDVGLAFAVDRRPADVATWRSLFPPAQGMAQPLAPVPAADIKGDARAEAEQGPGTITAAAAVTEHNSTLAAQLAGLHVLVLDDEDYARALVQRVLARIGTGAVATAASGREALALLAEPDCSLNVVVVDLRMPDFDGIEFLRALAGQARRPDVILLSGVGSDVLRAAADLARSHRLRVLGVLGKPVRAEALRSLLIAAREPTEPTVPPEPVAELDEAEFRNGLEQDGLVPFYQPKLSLLDETIVGVEALARWRGADGRLVGPQAFVPLAERCGLIHPMTLKLVRLALADCGSWLAEGLDIKLALNVSAASFGDLAFPDLLERFAATEGIAPARLILEVTERTVADDAVAMMDILMRLRLKGVSLSIDDFGTGYSSLQQLHRLPFSELKVDRSFVSGAGQDSRAYSILESSVALARKLGMTTIAEGVENSGDLAAVSSVGCDMAQGFLFARPMASADLLQWAAGRRRR